MERHLPVFALFCFLTFFVFVMADATGRYGGPGMMNVNPKRGWPELVGLAAEEAERKIKEEMPAAIVHVVPLDHFVTMDFNTGRVRLYIDQSGKVTRPPMLG